MITKLIGIYLIGIVLAAVGDAITAAVVAGTFSVVNTALLFLLHRRTADIQEDQKATKAALTAPRRIVYDQDGNPIGTVLDLHRGGDWDNWLAQHNRRAEDPPPPQP